MNTHHPQPCCGNNINGGGRKNRAIAAAAGTVLCHGDIIRLALSPLTDFKFRGYLRRFDADGSGAAIMDFADNRCYAGETTQWVLGDWQQRKGQPLLTGDSFSMLATDFQSGLRLDAKTQRLMYGNAWSAADPPTKAQLTCDGVAAGTPIRCNSDAHIYWLTINSRRIALSQPGMYYLSAGDTTSLAQMVVARLQCDAPLILLQQQPTTTPTQAATAAAATNAVVEYSDIVLPRRMYMTIDDSCSAYTMQLMDVIDRHRVPAVFFINGGAAQARYDALKRICQSPNAIVGIHTWTHTNMISGLTQWQARDEVVRTIQLVQRAHADVGRPWQAMHPGGLLLFRAPETDMGSGQRRQQMEQMLQELGFAEHTAMQACVFGTGSRQHSGLFLQDGLYGPERSLDDYVAHVRDCMQMFRTQLPLMFDPMVFGTHDLCRQPWLVDWLVRRGVEFIDPRQTFQQQSKTIAAATATATATATVLPNSDHS